MNTNPEEGIDFESGLKPEDVIVESPAAHANRMASLDEKYKISNSDSFKTNPEDLDRIEVIKENIKQSSLVVEGETNDSKKMPVARSLIEKNILQKEEDDKNKIDKGFGKGVVAATPFALAGLGAWIASSAGVGVTTTIGGLPLMSAVALASAPVAGTILLGAGVIWGARRLLNSYKANKDIKEIYA